MLTRNKRPGWEVENELATSLGFECVKDRARGWEWCRFELGEWHVWSLGFGWQVARYDGERYTDHFTKEPGVAGRAIGELRLALEYAKARHEGLDVDPETLEVKGPHVKWGCGSTQWRRGR